MRTPETPFETFPKMARLSRDCVVTEKIDGTNASVLIDDYGEIFAGSRSRWITPEQDNYGFARWVEENKNELLTLGVGRHHGEWWGAGIQRTYGEKTKQFSLFNSLRWIETEGDRFDAKQEVVPACCKVVPVLYRGLFDTLEIQNVLDRLRIHGSVAAPNFSNPEGIIVYHIAAGIGFKKTLDGNDGHKGSK